MHEWFFSGNGLRRVWRFHLRPGLFRLVAIVLAVNLAGTQVFAGITTSTWLGGSGNWSDGRNWSTGAAPQSANQAEVSSAVLITLDTDPLVFGLNYSSGVLVSDGTPRTLTVLDTFQWSSGQIGTNATVAIANQGSIDGSVVLRGGHLTVNGTLTHNNGVLTALSSTSNSITVADGGTYQWTVDTTALSAGNDDILRIESGGTATKTTGSGTTTVDWPVTNEGLLEVQIGTLSLTEGGYMGGTQSVASGAALGFNGGTFVLADGGSVSGAGTWRLASALELGGGTGAANAVISFPSGGTLGGSGLFNANSNVAFAGGDLQGSVEFNVNESATVTGATTMQGNRLNVGGTLTQTAGTISAGSGFSPRIQVLSNGVYDIANDLTFISGAADDVFAIDEGGTLRKSLGAGSATLDWAVTNLVLGCGG